MSLSPISESRLVGVYPPLAAAIHTLADMIDPDPAYHLIVTMGLRSWAVQDSLWKKGRDDHGNVINRLEVVTDAPPGHSWHQFGLGVDVAVARDNDNTLQWVLDSAIWQSLISKGESIGLVSGARWTHPKDGPHFQMTGRFGVSPDDEVKQLFINGGTQAVWDEAFGVSAT